MSGTRGGTYLCMEGPQFSTKAESNVYRNLGMDVIGMTNLQEAKLARELAGGATRIGVPAERHFKIDAAVLTAMGPRDATWRSAVLANPSRGADAFALAEIFGWSDVRMALRYTHATDESKRRAVENLVKPIGPSDESVTNEKGKVAALP